MFKLLSPEYRFFRRKISHVQYQIWEMQFKRFKTLEIREGIRKEYDQARSRSEILNTQVAAQAEPGGLKETNAYEYKCLQDQKTLLDRDIEGFIRQMKGLDREVHGSEKTEELPEGHQGLTQVLDSLRELKNMLEEYVRTEI